MKVVMNVDRSHVYLFVGLLILSGGMFTVNAINSRDPTVMGHSSDEILGLGDGVDWSLYVERYENLDEDRYGEIMLGGSVTLDSCDGSSDEFICLEDDIKSCTDFWGLGDDTYTREVRCDSIRTVARVLTEEELAAEAASRASGPF